jgi:hypothetical protein
MRRILMFMAVMAAMVAAAALPAFAEGTPPQQLRRWQPGVAGGRANKRIGPRWLWQVYSWRWL